MGSRRLILYLVFLSSVIVAQISVKTNLPEQLKTNSETQFEAKIWKGPIKNFSKYQLELPPGLTVSEVDCKSGSFVLEENLVKIIWAITPSEPEYTISLKLISDGTKGKKTIQHKYNYLEKGEKREIEMSPITIDFVDVLGSTSNTELAVETNTVSTEEAQAEAANAEDLRQQVIQLKKDSREALEVGESERAAARKKLYEANEAIKKAKAITNEKERSAALQKGMAAKDKAESDLAVANRILTLAKSLEDNALEIEKLNQSLDSVGINDKKVNVVEKGLTTSEKVSEKAETPVEKVNNPAVEKAKENAIKKGAKDAKGLYKPIAINPHNVKELIQQVEQIKKDSKEAREVGNREKKKAEQKLAESYDALKRAEYIADEEEKRQMIEKANRDKLKAEKDLEVASKILVLAQSLENNALEIERINDVEPTQAKLEVVANSATVSTQANLVAEKKTETKPTEPVGSEEKSNDVNEPPVTAKSEKMEEKRETAKSQEDLVYRLQIGAFVKTPDKSQFTSIGKVDIIKEGTMFKAIYGKFKTREEAVAKKEMVKSKGFDPFIVVFKNGEKVK